MGIGRGVLYRWRREMRQEHEKGLRAFPGNGNPRDEGAKVQTLTTERTKVVVPAFGIHTSHSRYPLMVVPAGTESSSDILSALKSVVAVLLGKSFLVLRAEPIEVTLEDGLELVSCLGT